MGGPSAAELYYMRRDELEHAARAQVAAHAQAQAEAKRQLDSAFLLLLDDASGGVARTSDPD